MSSVRYDAEWGAFYDDYDKGTMFVAALDANGNLPSDPRFIVDRLTVQQARQIATAHNLARYAALDAEPTPLANLRRCGHPREWHGRHHDPLVECCSSCGEP